MRRHLVETPQHLSGLRRWTTKAVLDYPAGNTSMSIDSWLALARMIAAHTPAPIARKIFTLAIEDRINLLPFNEVGELVMLCAREQPAAVWEVAAELSMGIDGCHLLPRIARWLIDELPDGLVRRWIKDSPADQHSRALIAARLAPVHGDRGSDLVEYLLTNFTDDEIEHAIEANLWESGGPGSGSISSAIVIKINQLHSWAQHSPRLQTWAYRRIQTLQQRLLYANQMEIEARSNTFQFWQ
jgi:hypothetical protein